MAQHVRAAAEKTTVDERTLVAREVIDKQVQAALSSLRTYAYRSAAPPRLRRECPFVYLPGSAAGCG